MSYSLNEKLRDLVPYDPISGNFEIRLDANESFFQVDEEILVAFKESLSQVQFNRYPDPYARRLNESFASFYGIDPAYVTAGNGSDEMCIRDRAYGKPYFQRGGYDFLSLHELQF